MDVSGTFSYALAAGNLAALPLALLGGVAAGLNPCCLALYPAAATVCCSVGGRTVDRPALGKAIAFVLGVAVAIAALGVIAAYVGRIFMVATPVKYGIAAVPIVMGVHQLGWLPLPQGTARTFTASAGGAFGMGALLALVIGPCGTPVLASVLSYAAYNQSFAYGGLLLFAYGLGSGLPVMLVGTAAGSSLKALGRTSARRWLDASLAGSLVVVGLYLIWKI